MKTTLDLPNDLIREIKLRAVNEGRKLKDIIAELLGKGLSAGAATTRARPSRVKLPLVKCRRTADLTPDQVAAVLLKQEVEWHS